MSLLCLDASARHGTFTAAAKELRLTQSAVSRQVIGLEKRLQTRLFSRRRDKLVLTDAGRYFLDEVGPFLKRLERATANVIALKGRGGRFNLSVGASLANFWLIPRLPEFTREHGEIALSFSTRIGPLDFSKVDADASLEFSDGQRAGLRSEFILPLVLAPYASPAWITANGQSITARTKASHLIHHTTVPEAWHEWMQVAGISHDVERNGLSFELMSMALNAAIAGLGAVLLPAFVAEDAVNAGRLKRLSRHEWRARKGYFLVYPKEAESLTALRAFREWLKIQAADHERPASPSTTPTKTAAPNQVL
jgi:LysR family glycine cleavage system transcriptional activator